MQLLSITSVEEDAYKNTLFDDPIHVSSYYIQSTKSVAIENLSDIKVFNELKKSNEDIYLGALKLKIETINYDHYIKMIDQYLKGLYKEEYIYDFYSFKQGNDKGIHWHEMIGDSFIQNEFLVTELWYSDTFENERIGYFVMDSLHPRRGCFKKIDSLCELNINTIELNTEQKLRYMLLFEKIGKEAFQSRYDISINELESWKKEPIGNYLKYMKENG